MHTLAQCGEGIEGLEGVKLQCQRGLLLYQNHT